MVMKHEKWAPPFIPQLHVLKGHNHVWYRFEGLRTILPRKMSNPVQNIYHKRINGPNVRFWIASLFLTWLIRNNCMILVQIQLSMRHTIASNVSYRLFASSSDRHCNIQIKTGFLPQRKHESICISSVHQINKNNPYI